MDEQELRLKCLEMASHSCVYKEISDADVLNCANKVFELCNADGPEERKLRFQVRSACLPHMFDAALGYVKTGKVGGAED